MTQDKTFWHSSIPVRPGCKRQLSPATQPFSCEVVTERALVQ